MSPWRTRELTAPTWVNCERKTLILHSVAHLIVSDGFSISKERSRLENDAVWTFACHVHLLAGVCGGGVWESHWRGRNRLFRLLESANHRQHAVCAWNQHKIAANYRRIHRAPLYVKQNGFYCNWWLFNGRHGKTNWIQLKTFFISTLRLQENWGLVSFKWKAFLFRRLKVFTNLDFRRSSRIMNPEGGRNKRKIQEITNIITHEVK